MWLLIRYMLLRLSVNMCVFILVSCIFLTAMRLFIDHNCSLNTWTSHNGADRID